MPFKDIEMKRKYQREWYARRRAAYMADKECVECGSKERLELDHIDPSQKTSHNIWSWRQERRDEEITKCQVLCKKCHDKKTLKDCYGKEEEDDDEQGTVGRL